MLAACAPAAGPDQGEAALGTVDGQPLHPWVVQAVAERDGLDRTRATARAADTLRLAAGFRRMRASAADDPEAEIGRTRVEHLLRTARARLWLSHHFEPGTRPADIPAAVVTAAAKDVAIVHPELHLVCQVIVDPVRAEGAEPARLDPAGDAQWWARAEAAMRPISARLAGALLPGDPKACEVLARIHALSATEHGDLALRIEQLPPLHLDACAEPRDDGTCARLAFAEEWSEQVRGRRGLVGPFRTRFGLHLAWVSEILPALEPSDPDFDDRVRAAIHRGWQREQLGRYLGELRATRAVRVREGSEAG